jgi:CBS domain containing-hemolysin-like protein
MIAGPLLTIAALTLLAALYVAAEFSAVGVRRSQLRQLADDGNAAAARLLAVVEDPVRLVRYIAGTQVGITLTNLVLGAVGQARLGAPLALWLGHWLSPSAAASTAAVVVLLGLSALVMVFGELTPKSLALQNPLRLALLTARPMRWSLALFAGPIWLVNGLSLWLLRRLGGLEAGQRHLHSPEEIDLLLVESRDGGLLEPDEQRRLHRALRLGHLTARQLMVPRMYLDALDVETPPAQVIERLLASPFTRLPVWRDTPDHVLGLLHTQDVVAAVAEHGRLGAVEPLLRQVPAISEHLSADRLLLLLREHRAEQALVIDEYGGLAGLVTVEDVLAEILEELPDTALGGQPSPERLPDGRVRLPGLLRLDEAEPWLGVLWSGEAETIGGRVAEELGRLPAPGARLAIDGVEVIVERVAHQAIAAILATPLPPPEAAEAGHD